MGIVMTIEELRKQVIQCRTLEEMRTVWGTLKDMGEGMHTNNFWYQKAENFGYSTGRWMSSNNRSTTTYQDFMAEFGTPKLDLKFLRKQVIGHFKDLAEMEEAWHLLRSIGETTTASRFIYNGPQPFYCSNVSTWGCTSAKSTMTLEQLQKFIYRWVSYQPIRTPPPPIQEAPDHDCSLHWYVSLGCCVKCNKDLDPRNKKDLYGILDEERRHKEFIAEVKRGRK